MASKAQGKKSKQGVRQRRKKKKEEAAAEGDKGAPSLEDIVISLQKSFSRVSRESGKWKSDNPDQALAYVDGPIKFAITLKLSPDSSNKLTYDEHGGMQTTIEGTINPDVRYNADEEQAK